MTKSTGKRPYRPQLSADELARAREMLVDRGWSYPRAAKAIGCATGTLQYHFPGVHPRRWRPLSPAEQRCAEQLLDEGASASEVARTIGVTPRTILNHFPGRGWTQEQTIEHQRALRQFDPSYMGFGGDR